MIPNMPLSYKNSPSENPGHHSQWLAKKNPTCYLNEEKIQNYLKIDFSVFNLCDSTRIEFLKLTYSLGIDVIAVEVEQNRLIY